MANCGASALRRIENNSDNYTEVSRHVRGFPGVIKARYHDRVSNWRCRTPRMKLAGFSPNLATVSVSVWLVLRSDSLPWLRRPLCQTFFTVNRQRRRKLRSTVVRLPPTGEPGTQNFGNLIDLHIDVKEAGKPSSLLKVRQALSGRRLQKVPCFMVLFPPTA